MGELETWWIPKVLLQSLKKLKPCQACSARCRSIEFRTILIAPPITLSVRTWIWGMGIRIVVLVKKGDGGMIRYHLLLGRGREKGGNRRTRGQLPFEER